MSKRGFGALRLPPDPSRKTYAYVLWVFAAALSLISIKSVLAPKPSRVSLFNLDNFKQLNSLSPVVEGFSDHGTGNSTVLLDTPSPEQRAVATTLYSESFASGVLALGHSLRAVQTSARRVLLYYPDRLTVRTLCHLQANGWELHPVPHGSDKRDLADQRLKLQLWTLDKLDIKSVIFLDGDTLVRRNFDELWALPFRFAAVPEVHGDARGFSLGFSTGMMHLRTSSAVFSDMLSKIDPVGYRRDEGEQEFLNKYFAAQVVKLPYIYNANLIIKQRSPALWSAIENDMRVVRYTVAKPFFEEERKRAVKVIWETEMEWWESTWRDTFRELAHRC